MSLFDVLASAESDDVDVERVPGEDDDELHSRADNAAS